MRFRRLTVSLCTTAVVALATLGSAFAQQAPATVGVVSVAPLDNLMSDLGYVLKAANFPEANGIVTLMTNQYTQGIDRTRPMGALITLAGQQPSTLLFLPMNNRDLFFGALAGMGIEPDDLGDGLFEIDTGGQVIYAKETNGWMFVAQTENSFANLPANPATTLGNLPERYNVAVRINVKQIPQDLKDAALEQIRMGYEGSMAQANQTPEQRAAAEEVGQASIEQFEQLFQDTEQLFIGWAVDESGQQTYVDGGAQFIEGSKLATQANLAQDATSDYTQFMLPNPAAKFRFTSLISEGDREVAKNNIKNSMNQVETQLDQSNDVPEEFKPILKELMSGLMSVMTATIDEGVFDGAGSLSVSDDTLRLLIGGRVADGNALAEELKKAAGKLSGTGVEFEFDYGEHEGVTLHRVSVPVKSPDPVAKKIFGEELTIIVGTADKGYLVSVDPAGDAAAKAAIDSMASARGVKATPFESVVKLEDLLRFAQSISPNSMLDNAVNTISQYSGKDKVQIAGRTIERGGVYRLSIEEGVLRSIGATAKGGNGGGGGF